MQHCGIEAEIASVGIISGGVSAVGMGVMGTMAVGGDGAIVEGDAEGDDDSGSPPLSNNFDNQDDCTSRKFNSMAKNIDDIEDLELGVPVNIAFDNRQRKR